MKKLQNNPQNQDSSYYISYTLLTVSLTLSAVAFAVGKYSYSKRTELFDHIGSIIPNINLKSLPAKYENSLPGYMESLEETIEYTKESLHKILDLAFENELEFKKDGDSSALFNTHARAGVYSLLSDHGCPSYDWLYSWLDSYDPDQNEQEFYIMHNTNEMLFKLIEDAVSPYMVMGVELTKVANYADKVLYASSATALVSSLLFLSDQKIYDFSCKLVGIFCEAKDHSSIAE